MDDASLASTESSFPCATVERTNATWSIPGSTRSPTYLPEPINNVGSSRRTTAFPRIEPEPAIDQPPTSTGVTLWQRPTACRCGSARAVQRVQAVERRPHGGHRVGDVAAVPGDAGETFILRELE